LMGSHSVIPSTMPRKMTFNISIKLSIFYSLDFGNIHQFQFLNICVFQTGYQSLRCVQGGEDIYSGLDSVSPDNKAVLSLLHALRRSIDIQINLMSQNQVHKVW